MPKYGIPRSDLTVPLPSNTDAHIWGPGELDYDVEIMIRSRASRTEVNPVTQQGMTIIDSAVFEYEMFHAWIEDRETRWDLYDEQGQPYDHTDRALVDRLFKGSNRSDRDYIIQKIGEAFFPEMFAAAQQQQAQLTNTEGTVLGARGEQATSPLPISSADAGIAASEQSQPQTTEWTSETGSTPSPEAMPSPVPS